MSARNIRRSLWFFSKPPFAPPGSYFVPFHPDAFTILPAYPQVSFADGRLTTWFVKFLSGKFSFSIVDSGLRLPNERPVALWPFWNHLMVWRGDFRFPYVNVVVHLTMHIISWLFVAYVLMHIHLGIYFVSVAWLGNLIFDLEC